MWYTRAADVDVGALRRPVKPVKLRKATTRLPGSTIYSPRCNRNRESATRLLSPAWVNGGSDQRELKRASAFGTKPVLAEAIELYHKRSICSHFHLSVLIGARIGAERFQADDCSAAGDGTQGYSHLGGNHSEKTWGALPPRSYRTRRGTWCVRRITPLSACHIPARRARRCVRAFLTSYKKVLRAACPYEDGGL